MLEMEESTLCIFYAFSGQNTTSEYIFFKFACNEKWQKAIYINKTHVNFFATTINGGTNHPFK